MTPQPQSEPTTEEQTVEIRHLQQQQITWRKQAYYLTVTQALKALGIPADEFDDYTLEYQTQAYDDLGMIPVMIVPDEEVASGMGNDRWRRIQSSETPRGTLARGRIPKSVIETLGYDPEDEQAAGEEVDILVGDGMIFLSHVDSKEFDIDTPADVDRVVPDN